jgi:hypothetical protein
VATIQLERSGNRVTIAPQKATLARMYISIQAIVLASLAVFGVDIVWSFLLIGVFGGPGLDSSLPNEQILAAMHVLQQDTRYLTCALILSSASTVLGGFLAARLAGAFPYFNAFVFGILGLVLSGLAISDVPTWFKVSGLALTLPAALLGGHIAKQRSHTRQS